MNILFTAFLYLPPPPTTTGDESGTEWFRIGGLVLVTVITITILGIIFRPTMKALIDEQTPQSDEDGDGFKFPEIKPVARVDTPATSPHGGLIQFPTRLAEPELSEDTFTAAAASERLRRLTTHKRTVPPAHLGERRRLGTRRTDAPGTQLESTSDPAPTVDSFRQAPGTRELFPQSEAGSDHSLEESTSVDPAPTVVPSIGEEPDIGGTEATTSSPDDSATITAYEPDAEEIQADNALVDASEQQTDIGSTSVEEGAEMREPVSTDEWDLIGELANRLPSREDRNLLDKTPRGFVPVDADLLGDIANRLPSDADRVAGGRPAKPLFPPPMTGDVPTQAEVDRIAAERSESGKIVQFIPRSVPLLDEPPLDDAYQILEDVVAPHSDNTANVTRIPVDLATREAVTATVQELLFCANVGEFMHGFALYTDRFLFKFMDDSGMDEDEFRKTFSEIPPKDPGEWTRIDAIEAIRRLDDGRISAKVRYIDGSRQDGSEDFTFKLDKHTQRWLIDDIQAV